MDTGTGLLLFVILFFIGFIIYSNNMDKIEKQKRKRVVINFMHGLSSFVKREGNIQMFTILIDAHITEQISEEVMHKSFEVWERISDISPYVITPEIQIKEKSVTFDWRKEDHHLTVTIHSNVEVEFFYLYYKSDDSAMEEVTNGIIPDWFNLYSYFFQEEKIETP